MIYCYGNFKTRLFNQPLLSFDWWIVVSANLLSFYWQIVAPPITNGFFNKEIQYLKFPFQKAIKATSERGKWSSYVYH